MRSVLRGAVVCGALLVALTACGPKSVFKLSADENNRYALDQTLARRQLPDQPSPVNVARQPRVFVVAVGPSSSKTIIAYDLASDVVMWKLDADVQSRISVGGDFVVALEGKQLVGRDQMRGTVRWTAPVPGTFVGATADRDRAYLVYKSGTTHYLASIDGGSGKQLWNMDAAGKLGAPQAQGGLIYVPFLDQWLAMIDGKTGEQLTRLRGLDEEISMLRATSQTVYYGSKQGVFRLDARSATGKRDQSTYGKVTIPPQLELSTYGRNVYDPIQQGYSAADRTRVLYAAEPSDAGPMKLTGDGYAIHYFRFVLGYGMDGALRWAYAHPRADLVASEHVGGAIAGISAAGDIVAIDPRTGAVRSQKKLGTTTQVLGATFDADGWAPVGQGAVIETLPALVAIARDHDARFDGVKELAVQALAKLPGPQVTTELLGVLADKRAPLRLKDTVVELLAARKDPASLEILTKQLAMRTDFLAKTETEALAPVARAISGLGGVTLDRTQVVAALAGLSYHLDAPMTGVPELVQVIAAMNAIGGGLERAALSSHILLYRSDDELGVDMGWGKAIVTALADDGPAERELLRQVAADPRTKPALTNIVREALGQ